MTNTIKTITPSTCPHCQKDIMVEFVNNSPEVSSIFSVEDVENAKNDVRERISFLAIDESKKTQVLEWLDEPETIFGPSEVDNIINSLLEK